MDTWWTPPSWSRASRTPPTSGDGSSRSLAAAAQALDLEVADVEGLCFDLVDAGMVERTRMQ